MRLLAAGKALFARHGYEQTSTAAIAREAGSSESQLIRYFGGKAGLLEAIFDDSWAAMNQALGPAIDASQHGRDAIVRILSLMIRAFDRDHDSGFLFLFEGRRMRGHTPEVVLSRGFTKFLQKIVIQIERGRQDGSFRKDIDPRVICSALLGSAEGMMRDRILAERNHLEPSSDEDILRTFAAVAGGLAPVVGSGSEEENDEDDY